VWDVRAWWRKFTDTSLCAAAKKNSRDKLACFFMRRQAGKGGVF
jgi:hypothetical protein